MTQSRWRRGGVSMLLAVTVLAVGMSPSTVVATENDNVVAPRADRVPVFGGEFEIPRPTGWTIVEPEEGTVAVFRSVTDERAQIEVRVSDAIPQRRWERFWRAFDSDLQETGFELEEPRRRQGHAGQPGWRYEYRLDRDDEAYRLVVWHTHETERAWVFSAFFREDRLEAYLQTFEEMLEAVEW